MAKKPIAVETLTHARARRRNIPTAELQSLVAAEDAAPRQVRYSRETPLPEGERRPRNPDLDPQLVWRGKDEQDWSDLVVQAPPLYVQEKIRPTRSSPTCCASRAVGAARRRASSFHSTTTSMACPMPRRSSSSTRTTRTGRTVLSSATACR